MALFYHPMFAKTTTCSWPEWVAGFAECAVAFDQIGLSNHFLDFKDIKQWVSCKVSGLLGIILISVSLRQV